MAAMTDYLENKLVDWLLRGQSFTPPATLYVALFTVAPADDGTGGTEVSGGSYARVAVTSNTTNWDNTQGADSTAVSSGTGGSIGNRTSFNFAAPTADWGTVVSFGLYDASSGGNCLMLADLTTSRVGAQRRCCPHVPGLQHVLPD
jgi:hypothetical protein